LENGQTCSVDVTAGAPGDATLALAGEGAAGTQGVALHLAAPPAPAPVVTPPAPAPVPVVAKATVPKVTLAVLSGHRVTLTSAGAGTVKLTLSRSLKRGKRTVKQTLATGSAKFTRKGTKTITLTLTRAGKAALKGGRHVKASGVLAVTVTGASSAKTVSLTLR
jgi:hypothetical protein